MADQEWDGGEFHPDTGAAFADCDRHVAKHIEILPFVNGLGLRDRSSRGHCLQLSL